MAVLQIQIMDKPVGEADFGRQYFTGFDGVHDEQENTGSRHYNVGAVGSQPQIIYAFL